jgi:NTP pyrophosphatase (non-canonical NTP hydrolase)
MEIVKKLIFQGKTWNSETRTHLIKELGDTVWYIVQACIALETTLDEVVQINTDKLMKRYPDGYFDVFYSENREKGDL